MYISGQECIPIYYHHLIKVFLSKHIQSQSYRMRISSFRIFILSRIGDACAPPLLPRSILQVQPQYIGGKFPFIPNTLPKMVNSLCILPASFTQLTETKLTQHESIRSLTPDSVEGYQFQAQLEYHYVTPTSNCPGPKEVQVQPSLDNSSPLFIQIPICTSNSLKVPRFNLRKSPPAGPRTISNKHCKTPLAHCPTTH